MTMKRGFVFVLVVLVIAISASYGQVLDGVYMKEHVLGRKPIPYQHLREADVMWSKTVWRKIVLTEKMNHPLYYPTEKMADRKSLIDLLLWAIDNEGLTAYNSDDPFNEFGVPMTKEQINVKFDAVDEEVEVEFDGIKEIRIIPGEIKSSEVKEIIVKELWFFDKQRSTLDVRIIGLCPIRQFLKDADNPETVTRKQTFWVYFPEVRRVFANNPVFNPMNDAESRTFDDLFHKRMFSSYIERESNSYNQRGIAEYSSGLEALLEAERIKEKIFNFEHDLWEY